MTTPDRTTARRQATAGQDDDRVAAFRKAQQRVLNRYGVAAEARFVDVPAVGGRAQVLVAGEGPPLVMVIGGTIPAALWAPLMAHLPGRTLYAMDLPGFGLTDAVDYRPETYRETGVAFLAAAGIEEIRDVLLACERLATYIDRMLGMMRAVPPVAWRPELRG